MKTKPVDQLVKKEFDYLISDYGFALIECKETVGGYVWLFLNATTGVHISYEYKEAYFHLTLYKLKGGKLIKNPARISPNSTLTGFSLDDILSLRNSEARVMPAYQYGAESEFYTRDNGFRLYISRFADNLKRYASDVLVGDFRLFEKLDPIVKQRASGKCK